MNNLQPRHHYFILGLAAIAAAFNILTAGAPYLYAESDLPSATPADTALTSPLPQDPVPTLPTPDPSTTTTPSPIPCFVGGQLRPCPPIRQIPPDGLTSGGAKPGARPIPLPLKNSNGVGDKSSTKQFQPPPSDQSSLPSTSTTPPVNKQLPVPSRQTMARDLTLMIRKLNRSGCGADVVKLKALAQQFQGTTNTDATDDDTSSVDTADIVDQFNTVKRTCELRQRLSTVDRQLKKLETLVKNPKSFNSLGLDPTTVTQNVVDMRTALDAAKAKLDESTDSSLGDVASYLDDLSDRQPQDVQRVIVGLQQLNKLTKVIKDKNVIKEISDALTPMIDALRDGNYQDAREILEQSFPELTRIAQMQLKLQRGRPGNRQAVIDKLNALEKKIKLQLGPNNEEVLSPATQATPAPTPENLTTLPTDPTAQLPQSVPSVQ